MLFFLRRIQKEPCAYTLSKERIEHHYNAVISHLRAVGAYKKTLKKFPPRAIYAAVKRVLERSGTDPLDLAVEFEGLRDFDTVQDFLEDLEKRHMVSQDNGDDLAKSYAEEELEEKAEYLGKIVLDKHDFYWLKRCEVAFKKQQRNLNGWPF